MERSKIEWTDATWNGWIGCEHSGPECDHCYAEVDTFARRSRANGIELWGGVDTVRHTTSDAYWKRPLAWAKAPEKLAQGRRPRVFAFSLGDVFEERADLVAVRQRFFDLVEKTPQLDWLILTKRPWAALDFFAGTSGAGYAAAAMAGPLLPNVWLGTTAGTQKTAKRISHLLECRPFVGKLFVSVEPMLEAMTLRAVPSHRGGVVDALTPTMLPLAEDVDGVDGIVSSLDWVICGGESGHKARPFDLAWARALRDECQATRVPFFFKQTGAQPLETTTSAPTSSLVKIGGSRVSVSVGSMSITRSFPTKTKKGGDLDEIPADLQIRQFPAGNVKE